MPRPNRDRVMVSFYISRAGKLEIEKVAEQRGCSKADAYRAMLAYAQQHMPRNWTPKGS